MTNNQYTDIIFVLDISGSMAGEKLERVKSDSKELILVVCYLITITELP